jgi:predicted DNA-binding transcriptional regulator YafY
MSLLERIYAFHSRIQAGRFPNANDLADEFEVSAATAHRDIAYLRDRLLAPLKFDPRKNGYFYEQENFRLPFEDSPRIVLFLGVLSSMASEAGLETLPELQQLQKKLSSLVPAHHEHIEDLIHCEWVEVQPVDKKVFDTVVNALLEGRQLELDYMKREDQPVNRRAVDPLKLVNYQGRWYLLAWCRLRRGKRMFHLSRIQTIRMTKQQVEHQLGKGDDYLTGVFGIFKGKATFTASIALTGQAAETVREQHWHPDQQIEQTDTGILLQLPVADDRELLMKVLQFGEEAEVLAPETLRNTIKEKILSMAERYA